MSAFSGENSRILSWLFVLGILAAAAVAGVMATPITLLLLLAGMGVLVVVQHLEFGLLALIAAALIVPLEISTGTEVSLNVTALIVPFMVAIWVMRLFRRRSTVLVSSSPNKPLFLFLVSGLLSLLIGNALWDPVVPQSGRFLLVQLAQWVIVALSAGAFLLTANLLTEQSQLRRLTFFFLILCAGLGFLFTILALNNITSSFMTIAFIRAPLWLLLTGLAGGQLFFNRQLGRFWQILMVVILVIVVAYSFGIQREVISNWIGVVVVLGMLIWLRWPSLRWPITFLFLLLALSGFLFPAIYHFSGGEEEWLESGGSRLALIGRVLSITWQNNPITGLGPAAYRPYSATQPLIYRHIVWMQPQVSSHNNYVDLFAHFGLVGLLLFFWFAFEVGRLGLRLRRRFPPGFSAAYVNSMLAVGAGALVIMFLADWILPFVYNIGFPGFQASVLVWLFMGGLVVLDQQDSIQPDQEIEKSGRQAFLQND